MSRFCSQIQANIRFQVGNFSGSRHILTLALTGEEMNDKFNRLMPESEGPALCYEISKPISREGYIENFLNPAKKVIESYGEIRLLTYFTSYRGWEEQAAELDIIAYLEMGQFVTKMAFVNTPEKEVMPRLIKKPMIKGEVKFFPEDRLQDAITWVKS